MVLEDTRFDRRISCPIIRKANPVDSEKIASLILNSNSKFMESVFLNKKEKAYTVLKDHYAKFTEGIYVLTDGSDIVGVMKLHLPNFPVGKTISFLKFISKLGIRAGLRAGILLSPWDEYRISQNESYIEYLYIHKDKDHFEGSQLLLEKAYYFAKQANSKFLTRYLPVHNFLELEEYQNFGFIRRKKISSPLAKLLRANHHKWYKHTLSIDDKPITFKEIVQDKLDIMREKWRENRIEVLNAVRLNVALTTVPLVAGSFAYARGYPNAAAFWALIAIAHLLGAKLYFQGSSLGRYGIAAGVIPEGFNLLYRAFFKADNWFDRSWLLPLSFLTFWIAYVVLNNPNVNISKTQSPEQISSA
ncbi:MAG: hypothetical protein OEY49_07345 [Candidatus Heimdallarchaeota archaeon]|nr:hypothetical protein [Candidatus Heimdallarchaeota archaeon]